MFEAAAISSLPDLTSDWGCEETVALYLDTCQVDTPEKLVHATWEHVHHLRGDLDHVVDFGAGDGRFALGGRYRRYEGFEIDEARLRGRLFAA